MFTTSPVSRVQALATDIEASISTRGLRPGDRIVTMEELRAQTGLARQTISEATRLLADRGIVEIRPGRGGGLFVATVNPVVRLRHTLLSVPQQSSTVADAIAVREALEELIDTDATRFRTTADVKDLRKQLTQVRRSTASVDRFMRANWALHERIAAVTPNEMARAVYLGTLRCISDLSIEARSDSPAEQESYLGHRLAIHVELVEAIVSGNVSRTVAAVAQHRGLTQDLAKAQRP